MIKKIILALAVVISGGHLFAQHQSVEFWPGGGKMSEGSYSADPGLLSTDSKEIAAEKLSKVNKTGDWNYWFSNGKPSAVEHYTSSGAPTGTWKNWHTNGQQSVEINFQTGSATYWYENGSKSAQGSMLPGMIQTGRWVNWHENGQKNSEGSYNSSGMQIGVWTYWNAQGKKTAEQTWNNGELVDTKRFE